MQQIDQYRIIRLLGKGSTGEVYEAMDGLRSVAIKWYQPGLAQLPDSEWATLRQIQHPNIVQAIERRHFQGRPYLVMEYVEGLPLNEVSPGSLSPEQINSVALQLALGIHFAHIKKLVHRDIKPENILITPDNTVKILDFGVAAPITFDPNIRLVEGSYAYMAPEQLTGKINLQNDIWAYGVTLYEWLTSRHPYPSQTLEELSRQVMLLDVEYAHHLKPGIPPRVSWVLKKCLQGNLRRRYTSFEEILVDLTPASTSGRWWDQAFDPAPVQKFIRQHFSTGTRLISYPLAFSTAGCLMYLIYIFLNKSPDIGRAELIDFLIGVAIIGVTIIVALWQFKQMDRLKLNEPETIRKLEFFQPQSKFIQILKNRVGAASDKEWNDKLIGYYFKTNQGRAARILAKKVLQHDPNNIKALSLLALQEFAKSKWAEARVFCQRILAVNPDDASSVFFTRMLTAHEIAPSKTTSPTQEVIATQKREAPVYASQEVARITSLEQTIAEQGFAKIPVQIVLENFVPIKAGGDLVLHENFMNLVLDDIDEEHLFWLSRKIKSIRSRANQNIQINAGKLVYFQTQASPATNVKKELATEGATRDYQEGWRYLIRGAYRFVEAQEKSNLKSNASLNYTIPYDKIKRLAFGGQIIEAVDFGLINFEINDSLNRENFLQFVLKRQQKNNRPSTDVSNLSRVLLFLPLALLTLIVVLFVFYKIALFAHSKIIQEFEDPVAGYFFILVIVAVTVLIQRKLMKQAWYEIRSQAYYVFRLVKHYLSPEHNDDWIQLKERDAYLECYRLLFQFTLVEYSKEQEFSDQDTITVFPFIINRAEKWIRCNKLKSIPFEAVSSIVIQPDELNVFVGKEHYCRIKLNPDEFRNYFPKLFDVFQYKIHLGY